MSDPVDPSGGEGEPVDDGSDGRGNDDDVNIDDDEEDCRFNLLGFCVNVSPEGDGDDDSSRGNNDDDDFRDDDDRDYDDDREDDNDDDNANNEDDCTFTAFGLCIDVERTGEDGSDSISVGGEDAMRQ